jgi:hypothetical protein
MPRYRVCELVFDSDIEFPEVRLADETEALCSFLLRDARKFLPSDAAWFHHWGPSDDDRWVCFADLEGRYLLRFIKHADFLVSRDASVVQCHPLPGIPESTVRHLFLDQVLPVVLSARGELVMHSSAVVTPHGAVGFLGPSGMGKSTLAACFVESGSVLLTDDCLLIRESGGKAEAFPSYPGVRLWEESIQGIFERQPVLSDVAHYTEKRRVSFGDSSRFSTRPALLRRLFLLAEVEEDARPILSITPLRPRNGLMELVKNTYVLDIRDTKGLAARFDRLSRLAARGLVYELHIPRQLPLLPRARQAILEHLAEEQDTALTIELTGERIVDGKA